MVSVFWVLVLGFIIGVLAMNYYFLSNDAKRLREMYETYYVDIP